MDPYFDSAVIVKLYVKEATSPEAIRLASPWQELEVKNAIRLKAFRGEITAAEMGQSIAAFEQDILTGRWQHPPPAAALRDKAEELSAAYSPTLGYRTLDILHIAAALVIEAKEFISFDQWHRALV